jgi:hypothetical protein
MGLPCTHICDIRRVTGGLIPLDFHEHWYWDRNSTIQPLLDPLRARKQHMGNPRVARTGRILSRGEEQAKRLLICSACYRQGHTMSSRNCPLKLQASITMQSQMFLDLDIITTQSLAPVTPIASITLVITARIASIVLEAIAPIASTTPEATALTTSIALEATAPIASTALEVTAPTTSTTLKKQLSPDRPEVLMQAYLAEKTAWLAQHLTVRPTEYRKARKWKTPRPKVLKEQAFYMPRERRDLAGTIIVDKANWTNEEIIVWLDNEERKEEEEYNRLQVEFDANGQRHIENTHQEIWARVEGEVARDSERYIL